MIFLEEPQFSPSPWQFPWCLGVWKSTVLALEVTSDASREHQPGSLHPGDSASYSIFFNAIFPFVHLNQLERISGPASKNSN